MKINSFSVEYDFFESPEVAGLSESPRSLSSNVLRSLEISSFIGLSPKKVISQYIEELRMQ